MKKVKGDLLKLAEAGEFDVIVQGCNCFCTMGAGIARQISTQYPEAYKADKYTVNGDKSKLGNYSFYSTGKFTIINGYTQYRCDGRLKGEMDVDYVALRSVFRRINKDFAGKRVGYPKIGCDLARGDWEIVSVIIDEELVDVDHTFVEWDPNA